MVVSWEMSVDQNPFATPKVRESDLAHPPTDHDQFITREVETMLEPGERLIHTAFLLKAPSLWLQLLFNGLIMLFFIKPYLAACTNRRLILLRTKNGFVRPKMLNLETEEIVWSDVQRIQVSGFANNRSLTFFFNNDTKRTLRIAPWAKFVSGQKSFFDWASEFDPSKL